MKRIAGFVGLVGTIWSGACADAGGTRERLLLGTTHTLEDSGLLQRLTESFDTAHPDYRLVPVVAGSNEVLALARRGDLDVLLTHSPDDETAFISSGRGESRQQVMRNEFLLVGPSSDPAGAAAAGNVVDALRAIQDDSAQFVSRGDQSGTHRRELALWAHAQRVPGWSGYIEAGVGMADALRVASQREAYALTDPATWHVLRSELDMTVIASGDDRLVNQYSVIVVAGAANLAGARAFAAWMRSPSVRRLIGQFGTDVGGSPLFMSEGSEAN